MKIEAYGDNTIYFCRFCHMCQHACTVANATQNEADTTRGKLFTLFTVLRGSQQYGLDVAALMSRCTMCRLCKEWCFEHFDPAEVIAAARADLAAAGAADPRAAVVGRRVAETGNPFGADAGEGRLVLTELGAAPQGEVLYYPGCTALYRQPGIARAMARLFQAAGIDFQVPAEPLCCGVFLHQLGFGEQARCFGEENLRDLASRGVKTVVFACPHCLKAFCEDYRNLGLAVPAELHLVHQAEFAADLLRTGRIKPRRQPAAAAVYHDPCTLGRQLGRYEGAREVLAQVTAEPVEMHWNREKAHCCGAGGGVFFTRPEIAQAAAGLRLEEARAAGARVVATACPLCRENLRGDGETDVKDVVELLAESV